MKTLFALCLALALSACAVVPPVESPLEFKTIGAVSYWIDRYIAYEWDPLRGAWDAWQMPATTLERRKGDCEDISLLWLYLVNENFSEKGELVICRLSTGMLHCYARLDECAFNDMEDSTDILALSYDQAMDTAKIKALKEGVR